MARGLLSKSRTIFSRNIHTSKTVLMTSFSPLVIEETIGGGERAYDIYSRLLKERIVCLMDSVGSGSANAIIAQLLFLQSEDQKKPIQLYINSPGGSISAGLGIYDTMQYISPPVTTWCVGEACSMAAFLLAAGEKGHRHSLPHSRIMIHQPHGSAGGQATDIAIQAKEMLDTKNLLTRLMALHSGQPIDKLSEAMERDRYMTPVQAKEFGLIDHVL